jgi:hypothetical protein
MSTKYIYKFTYFVDKNSHLTLETCLNFFSCLDALDVMDILLIIIKNTLDMCICTVHIEKKRVLNQIFINESNKLLDHLLISKLITIISMH